MLILHLDKIHKCNYMKINILSVYEYARINNVSRQAILYRIKKNLLPKNVIVYIVGGRTDKQKPVYGLQVVTENKMNEITKKL